jgi:hypothetical protein
MLSRQFVHIRRLFDQRQLSQALFGTLQFGDLLASVEFQLGNLHPEPLQPRPFFRKSLLYILLQSLNRTWPCTNIFAVLQHTHTDKTGEHDVDQIV